MNEVGQCLFSISKLDTFPLQCETGISVFRADNNLMKYDSAYLDDILLFKNHMEIIMVFKGTTSEGEEVTVDTRRIIYPESISSIEARFDPHFEEYVVEIVAPKGYICVVASIEESDELLDILNAWRCRSTR